MEKEWSDDSRNGSLVGGHDNSDVNTINTSRKNIPDLVDKNEERFLRKLDLHILPFLSFLYLLSYLDRANIGNAHDPLVDSLNLEEKQFSMAVGVFYIGYILFEVPANLILKRTNPGYWLGSLVVAWGICSTCMVFAKDFASLMLIRTFLGIAESGFFPGVVFYLSRWYKPHEQSLRISLFYCSSALSGVISGLLAYGFLQMDDVWILEGWQWLFLCEGFPSIVFGMLTWYILPSSPAEVSWLTAEEKERAFARLGHINEADKIHTVSQSQQVIDTLLNLKIWAFGVLFFGIVTPAYATSFYTPAIIGEMGYDTLEANLLSSPVSFVSFLIIVANGYHSDLKKERPWHFIVPCSIACLSFLWLTIATYYEQHGLSYAAMYFATGTTATCIPIALSWVSSSIQGSTQVAVATAMVVGVGNIGGIVGPNLYGFLYIENEDGEDGESDGSYVLGHMAMTIILFCNVLLALLLNKTVKVRLADPGENDPLLKGKNLGGPIDY